MKIVKLVVLLLTFVNAKSEIITTIGGTTTTGSSSFLCLTNPFSQSSNVNSSSLTDYAQFSLVAGAGCSYYLHSTLSSIGAAGTEAGFRIQTGNLTSLLSGITLDTYLDGAWQESASGSNLLSLFSGGEGDVFFKTTKAYNALRIRFNSFVAVAYSARIYWGYGDNTSVQTLPFSFQKFNLSDVAGKVHLSWSIADHNEIESINIEKSLDNHIYKIIGTVLIAADQFNTYVDQFSTKAWYRLKATLKSGKILYSRVLYYASSENATVSIFPNPVKGNSLYVRMKSISDQSISYVILDAIGRMIQKGSITSELQLDVKPLKKGLYFFQTSHGETMQFLKQ